MSGEVLNRGLAPAPWDETAHCVRADLPRRLLEAHSSSAVAAALSAAAVLPMSDSALIIRGFSGK